MKRRILIITFALGSFCFTKAQDEDAGKRGEKIQALKIAFITQKLALSSEEAQRFWPVYNQYENEIKSLFRENGNGDVIENDERLLNIRKKYRPEFVKVLGDVRMNKLFLAEKEFRGVLLQHLKNRNNQQGQMLRRR
ncbi:MAG: hypothetical protein ABJA71_13610 [Ginsengibacter sp.]